MDPLKVIQISDPHLFGDPAGVLRDVVTRQSLRAVLTHIIQHEAPFDVVVVTGDLAQDESEPAYAALAQMLAVLELPVLCLPGNHDDPKWLNAHLNTQPLSCAPLHRFGMWDFHLLNTRVVGEVYGRIDRAELDALGDRLSQSHKDRYSAVWLHHPPFAVGSRWLDDSCLQEAQGFLDLCHDAKQVRAIFCGHVHQSFESKHGNMLLASAPSTCAQFRPQSDDYALDDRPPGYRVSQFYADGSVESEARWLVD